VLAEAIRIGLLPGSRGIRELYFLGGIMRKNKYHNIKTTINGIKFDSKKEANRYLDLQILERIGEISKLETQPKFEIVPAVKWNKTLRARFYIADFQYVQNNETIIEDVKSPITKKNPVYTLKRQLFLAQYGNKYKFIET
jgi:Protein of unknown function (DUF1064)